MGLQMARFEKVMVYLILLVMVMAIQPKPMFTQASHGDSASDIKLLVLGDSITYGVGAIAGLQDYPALLAQHLKIKIINAGVPGNTSKQGLARLGGLIKSYHPQLLMVELGGNDLLEGKTDSEVQANLISMIQLANTQHIKVMLIPIPRVDDVMSQQAHIRDSALYDDVAKQTGVFVFKRALSDLYQRPELKADMRHLNAQGYELLAKHLAKQMLSQQLLN